MKAIILKDKVAYIRVRKTWFVKNRNSAGHSLKKVLTLKLFVRVVPGQSGRGSFYKRRRPANDKQHLGMKTLLNLAPGFQTQSFNFQFRSALFLFGVLSRRQHVCGTYRFSCMNTCCSNRILSASSQKLVALSFVISVAKNALPAPSTLRDIINQRK